MGDSGACHGRVAAPGDGVRLRAARRTDVRAAVELFRQLDDLERDWRVFEPRRTAFADTRARYQRLAGAEDGIIVVAESSTRLVGLGVGEVCRPSSWSDERALNISNVYVDPAFRGHGIGGAIVAELAAFGASRGLGWLVLRVFAPNEEAAEFWAGLGFRPRLIQFTARTSQLRHDACGLNNAPPGSGGHASAGTKSRPICTTGEETGR
jgi:ribosomal protein S18 acetylase RimI-like enzyme